MGDKSKIEWTEATINPIVGCSKVSPGCLNCYAERMANRLAAMNVAGYQEVIDGYWDGHAHVCKGWNDKTVFVKSALEKPLHWKKPRKIFVCSMGDLFHESASFEWIDKVMEIITWCPEHEFQVLTKRPKRMKEYIDALHRGLSEFHGGKSFQWPFKNLMLGVTCENQVTAEMRIPLLSATPAAKKFISVEPMLEELDLSVYLEYIDWVVCGCESGPNRRKTKIEWIRGLRDQCVNADVPFFLKQMDVDGKVVKMPALDGKVWEQYSNQT